MLRILVVVLYLLPVSRPVHAMVENWTVYDLGSARTEAVCVGAAQETFEEFAMTFGARKMARGSWVVYAWGLARGQYDAIITCALASGGTSRATLIIYAEDSVLGSIHGERIWNLFSDHNQRLGDKYVNDALEQHGLN